MNVLSLFDGMSCLQIALGRAGVKVENYYASEVDKYAIKVTMANYPDTHQLGDITQWRDWDVDWSSIDLVAGGSPCQGFSFAGKQLAFDDPRSALFFTYLDILNHIRVANPAVKFLLENVKMKKEYLNEITRLMGVEPVLINSALVSAQNRQRYYWTNIGNIEQPDDKGILLKDVIEGDCYIKNHDELIKRDDKSTCVDANYHKGVDNHGQRTMVKCGAVRGRCIVDGVRQDHKMKVAGKTEQRLEVRKDDKTNCLTSVQKDNVLLFEGKQREGSQSQQRMFDNLRFEKSKALTKSCSKGGASNGMTTILDDNLIRKLTPIECERLQTVPDNYTNHVSNTQRYKILGNGWTVDVIVHILKYLNIDVSFL